MTKKRQKKKELKLTIYRNTEKLKITELTTRELKREIRKLTAEANIKLSDYRSKVKAGDIEQNDIVEDIIEQMKYRSGYISKKGEYHIPKGKYGEIGLGLTYKTKKELQTQLSILRRFDRKDVYTPQAVEELKAKTKKQYNTFLKNQDLSEDEFSFDEYQKMFDVFNVVKSDLKDFAYEDKGNALARSYSKIKDKSKFIDVVKEAKEALTGVGASVKDFTDKINDIIKEKML